MASLYAPLCIKGGSDALILFLYFFSFLFQYTHRNTLFSRYKMQFSKVLIPAVLASYVSASNVTVTTDVVVTDYTTYCPEPTSVVVNNKTITVTEATTLTITGPCTIPTTYTTNSESSTETPAPSVSSVENGAGKAVVGAAAGIAAIAAAIF